MNKQLYFFYKKQNFINKGKKVRITCFYIKIYDLFNISNKIR